MTTAARSPGTTAEHDRLAQATGRAEGDLFESNSWYEWGPISPNVPVAPYGRTTATTVMPGASFLMIMRAPGPTAGTKTAWPVGGISMGCPAMPGCAGESLSAGAFPYQWLIDANGRRSRDEPEFELIDTGVFDHGRYWAVESRTPRPRGTCSASIRAELVGGSEYLAGVRHSA
jgi:hypothetical protein